MAKWSRVTTETITDQQRVRVTDGQRQGFASVSWSGGINRLTGSVYEVEHVEKTDINKQGEITVILDNRPEFLTNETSASSRRTPWRINL